MKKLSSILFTLILLVSLNGCTYSDPSSDIPQNLVSVSSQEFYEETQSLDENTILLDIRTPEEYASGHLENAELLNYYDSNIVTKLNQLDKRKTYLIYCRSGNRSGQALKVMKKLGFESVYNLENGINDWSKQGLPIHNN